MNADEESCVFPECQATGSKEYIVITQKGADSINNASVERGDTIIVAAGTKVHKMCRLNYTNKKDIERHNKAKLNPAPAIKRSVRVSSGPYDSKRDCLFCGSQIIATKSSADYDEYSFVRTETFVDKILQNCNARNDEWAFIVKGRVEYFGRDLHAADCVYHHSCDINFRTFRDIPAQHRLVPDNRKRKKVGRPTNNDQEQAFLRVCAYFEENDEEQFTVTDLANKMKEYLQDSESSAYGNQYLKSKLLEHYGDSVFVAERGGLQDIVTFHEKTSTILRDYFLMPKDDEEAQKQAIIETATKLIKSDIKSVIQPVMSEYPNVSDLKMEAALEYVPPSLRFMLQHLLVGKDTRRKVASIGHAIIQAVRPKTVIAPLQLGLAVGNQHNQNTSDDKG